MAGMQEDFAKQLEQKDKEAEERLEEHATAVQVCVCVRVSCSQPCI